jgi:hypothetical protein
MYREGEGEANCTPASSGKVRDIRDIAAMPAMAPFNCVSVGTGTALSFLRSGFQLCVNYPLPMRATCLTHLILLCLRKGHVVPVLRLAIRHEDVGAGGGIAPPLFSPSRFTPRAIVPGPHWMRNLERPRADLHVVENGII